MDPSHEDDLLQPAALVRTEAAALLALADRLEGPMSAAFTRAVELILRCGEANGRVVVTGMGKSGIIAQKIAATLSSTGSAALFLHPAEAVHGDLGVLMPGDVVIALSASGETEEILRLLATLKRKGDALISFCCNLNSTLAQASNVALDCSVEREACGLNLAPTASTTAMLALGDALAIAVSLAQRLPRRRLRRSPSRRQARPASGARPRSDAHRRCSAQWSLLDHADDRRHLRNVIEETRHHYRAGTRPLAWGHFRWRLAQTARTRRRRSPDPHRRRSHERQSAHDCTEEFAATALAILEARKITSLIVVDANHTVEGILHLHDLWGVELI